MEVFVSENIDVLLIKQFTYPKKPITFALIENVQKHWTDWIGYLSYVYNTSLN